MIHPHQVPWVRGDVKRGPRLGRVSAWLRAALGVCVVVGCDGEMTVLEPIRFGEVGYIQVDVVSRLDDDRGALTETLRWVSDGKWGLAERVSYRGVQGSETVRRSHVNPGELVAEYASLVQQLNEATGLRLLGGAVSEDLLPTCDPGAGEFPTRVAFTMYDELRDETHRWVRCANGSLLDSGNPITPGEAGPDPQAARVITAAQLTRFFTIGEAAESTYTSTIPYGTLDQGTNSLALPAGSKAFVSASGFPPPDFVEFWRSHAGAGTPLPFVAWGTEFVLLAAVGPREEAGDFVQVRRVLEIGSFTRVEVSEQVPGNFCSPAAKRTHPFHLIVVPAVQGPIEFTSPQVERIPCGA